MQNNKNYEQSAEFKFRNAVSHRFPLVARLCAHADEAVEWIEPLSSLLSQSIWSPSQLGFNNCQSAKHYLGIDHSL